MGDAVVHDVWKVSDDLAASLGYRLYGLDVVDAPHLPPNYVVRSGNVVLVHSVEALKHALFLAEIRAQVRRSILAAHPWIRLPNPALQRILDEQRLGLSIVRPSSFVTGTFAP